MSCITQVGEERSLVESVLYNLQQLKYKAAIILIANIILAGSTQPREDRKLQEIFNVLKERK